MNDLSIEVYLLAIDDVRDGEGYVAHVVVVGLHIVIHNNHLETLAAESLFVLAY